MKKILAFSLVSVLCAFLNQPVCAQAERLDSLKRLAFQSLQPSVRISALNDLSRVTRQRPEEVGYLLRLLEEGRRIDSVAVEYTAVSNLCRYYYNDNQRDSIHFWAAYVDSVARQRNEYPDALFDVYSYICQDHLWNEDYELAMNGAVRLHNLARDNGQTYGQLRCCENLGLIYQTIRRDSDAVVFFEEALNLTDSLGGQLTTRIRLLSYQIESVLRAEPAEKAFEALEKYRDLLDRQAKVNLRTGSVYPVDRYRWLMYCFYTDLYLRQDQLGQAKHALDMAHSYEGAQAVEDDYVGYLYESVKARYYKATGNYALAHQAIDSLLTKDWLPEDWMLKAEILVAEGRFPEAIVVYKKLLELTTRMHNESFTRQINQLRTLYDLNDKELQAKELQISNMKVTVKQRQLRIASGVCLVLLILLYILYILFRRTRRLKDALLREKDSLITSEHALRIAKEKAEAANQAKTDFIANISHEIRTPLNAIVGFAGLLSDPSGSDEERTEYAGIINNNTELLLNLVNDVLDLSRIESGTLPFSFQPSDLVTCCRHALESIRHRVQPGVALTFSPPVPSFTIQTDPLRLQQLLVNLLMNAAKFTLEEEINLAFETDEERQEVRISVMDTGCGIPLAQQEKIFERFEKLDGYSQGMGLGLSICRRIAKRLGATLVVDPLYRKGARFVLTHPYSY